MVSFLLDRYRENDLFKIEAENVACGSSGTTCTKSVSIEVGDVVYKFVQGMNLMVGDKEVDLSAGGKIEVSPGVFYIDVNVVKFLVFSNLDLIIKTDGGERGHS